MGTYHSDDEYSEISEKPEVGFLDFEDDKSLHNYDHLEEGPVDVSVPFPFVGGKPQSAFVGETSAETISIKNTTADTVDLWSVRIFSSNPEDSYILSLMKPPLDEADEEAKGAFVGLSSLENLTVQPQETLTIWLSCKPKDIGLHTSIVHVDIGDEKIERVAFLLADDNVSKALFSNKPFSRASSQKKRYECAQYVPGSRPTRQHTQGFKYKLPQFAIPRDIREIIQSKQIPDVLHEELSMKNYATAFSTLLVMEEIYLEEEMTAYDMECVSMKRRGNTFLSLEVPGLAERRPSLVNGDYILARLACGNSGNDAHAYQGFIHRVEADEIFLRFDKKFHFSHHDRNRYSVSFTYNRLNMRRLYKAIHDAAFIGPGLLFPWQSSCRRVRKWSFKPLNPYINSEQADAVGMILGCKGLPPYVIHGPPGTGKTMTVVEAVLQLYTAKRNANILICAASNSAADHVLEKLLHANDMIRANDVFRLNAVSRPYEDLNPDFVRFCFFEDMVFKCPPLQALLRYKIIVSTYVSTCQLQAEGIRRGHFSHIFLDEAGQASEPEAVVPLSGLCGRDTVVVLAGDPMQLGPVVFSKEAEKYGLGISYLERLFTFEHYARGDPNYVTKLVRNYRCHPAILELPSKLFYGGELIACKEDDVSSIYDLIDLPNKSFPVLFIGIQGCDEREGSNPSWFNRIEASKVVDIVRKLMRGGDICEADIGIITPYRQQVVKLKKALDSFDMPDLKVGSVEQFQGQERQIIIISTVRSTVKHNEFDKFFNLGFLSNYRRFNVAITRAKSLLIIVGNPHIITKDRHWDRLLRYCADNGSYQGCPLPPPELHCYPEEEPAGYDDHQDEAADYDYEQEEPADHYYNQEPPSCDSKHDASSLYTKHRVDDYDYKQEEPSDHDYNQGPALSDYQFDAGSSHTKDEVEWPEETPNEEHPSESCNEAELCKEMPPGNDEQYDMPKQHLNKETLVQDTCPPKYSFPDSWCDVSNIEPTGWDD